MIIIAFGANEDSKHGNLVHTFTYVCNSLAEHGIDIQHKSSLWQTSPVGENSGDKLFINAVIGVQTAQSPEDLLETLMKVEQDFGRERSFKNAPRCVDLDIIAYNNEVIDSKSLTLPHPRMHQRGFVLWPLQEISPNWQHPTSGRTVVDLIEDLPVDQKGSIYER